MAKFYQDADLAGLKRRTQYEDPDLVGLDTSGQEHDPNKGNFGAETVRSQAQRIADYVPALGGLGRQLLGDQEGAKKDYAEFSKGEQHAHDIGPSVQTFADAKAAGGGAGDYLKAAGYQAAAFVPDVALAATGAGITADIAGGVARRVVRTSVADAIERRATSMAAKEEAARAATRAAAVAAPDGASAVSGAIRVANAQVRETARKAAMNEAAKIAGRIPRFAEPIAATEKIAGAVGGAAGFYPSTVSGSVDELNQHPDQASALKIGGMDALAALAGSLPFGKAFEGASPAIRDAAAAAIKKKAERFLPQLAKHGLAGGTGGVAMTATQLAGHSFVNDNIDLLDQDSRDKYLDSFVGGAIAGGTFHGAGHAVRGVKDVAGYGATKFKDAIKASITKYGEKARMLRGQADPTGPQPGDEIGAGGPADGATPSGLSSFFKRASDTLKSGYAKGSTYANDALGKFKQHESNIHNEQADEESANALHDAFIKNGGKIPDRVRASNQLPADAQQLPPMAQHGLGFIPKDSPIWSNPAHVREVGDSLGKLIGGDELSPQDHEVHQALLENGDLSQVQLDAMKMTGELYGPQVKHAANADAADAPAARGAVPEEPYSPALGEQVANHREAVRAATQRVSEATTPDGKAAAVEERRQANKDFMRSRQALRDHLLGEVTPSNRYGKNVFYQSSKDPAPFDARMSEPGRVQIDDIDVGRTKPIMARAGLSLDSLAAKEIGQHSEDYQNLPEADRGKAAFMRVVGDLKQAGINIKPESITPGEIGKVGNVYLGSLSERDVADLQGLVRNKAKFEPKPGVSSPELQTKDAEFAKDAEMFSKDKVQGEEDNVDPNAGKLLPRSQPTGRKTASGDFVPDEGISGVSLHPSHESTIAEAGKDAAVAAVATTRIPRAARRSSAGRAEARQTIADVKAKAKAEGVGVASMSKVARKARDEVAARTASKLVETRRVSSPHDPRFKAGVEIGAADIAARTASPRTAAGLMAKLHDPSSGVAERYYRRALAGDFDGRLSKDVRNSGVSVSEKKADLGLVDQAAAKAEREQFGAKAYEAGAPAHEAPVSTGTGRYDVKPGDDFGPAMKGKVPAPAEVPTRTLRSKSGVDNTAAAKQPIARVLNEAEGKVESNPAESSKDGTPAKNLLGEKASDKAVNDVQGKVPDVREAVAKTQPKEGENVHFEDAGTEAIDSLGNKDGEHDHAAETKMLNDVARRAGITDSVRAIPLRPKVGAQTGGQYDSRGLTIAINDNLHGAERTEVLMHELGHHIIYSTIAKKLGIEITKLGRIDSPQLWKHLKAADPKLHDALKADYEKWQAENANDNLGIQSVRSSRAPFFRSAGLAERSTYNGRKMSDLSEGGRASQRDAHEWLADNIAKALTEKKESQSIISKFFKPIAEKLRAMFDTIRGDPGLKQYTAAKSVDEWVQSMFDANVKSVKDAIGITVPVESAANAVTAAVEAYMRKNPAGFDPIGPARGPTSSISDGGSRDRFNRDQSGDAAKRHGRAYDPSQDPNHTQTPFTQESFNSLRDFMRVTLPKENRGLLDRVLNRPAAVKAFNEQWGPKGEDPQPEFMKMLDDGVQGLENRATLGYLLWEKGKFQTGPKGELVFAGVEDQLASILNAAGEGDLAHRVFADIANGTVQRFHEANKKYDVRELEARSKGVLQKALNYVHGPDNKVAEGLSKFWTGSYARMWASGIGAQRELLSTLQRRQFSTKDAENKTVNNGMIPSIVHTLADFEKDTRDAMDGLTRRQQATAMDMLQRQMTEDHPKWESKNPKSKEAVVKIRAMMDRVYKYLQDAGVDVPHRENFFPVVIDLRNEAAKTELTNLYNQPHFEAHIRLALGYTKEGKRVASKKPIDELIKNLVDGAVEQTGSTSASGSGVPNFRGLNHRLSDFIFKHGTEADIKTFAGLQSKNAPEVFARYLGPMVKHAEYTRHLGSTAEQRVLARENAKAKLKKDDPSADAGKIDRELDRMADEGAFDNYKRDAIMERIREQGGSQAQIDEAHNVIKGALGTYGADGSPVLKMLSPKLAEKLHTQRTRDFIQGAQAYQNSRVLPLAMLSSLVDPLGIAVRTGGDFSVAWDGFKQGIKALYDKPTAADLHAQLEQLGAANDNMFVLHSGFGGSGDVGSLPNKINETVFRWNGMEKLVLTTRYQALVTAHAFLLKHASGDATPHSQRYNQELLLEPGDVTPETVIRPNGESKQQVKLLTPAERAGASKEEVARDDRVRNAMRSFIDDAILRPNSVQRPLWHNDPYMGLMTQYKSFGYALYDQIVGRYSREIQHGNSKVIGAMMAYLPVTLAAELIREMIQYGPDGNPNRKSWGPAEYTMMAASRTGFQGPQKNIVADTIGDVKRHNLPGASQLGPTVGQANNLVDAVEGKRDLSNQVVGALPASTAYHGHFDDTGAAGGDGGSKPAASHSGGAQRRSNYNG